MEAVIEVSQQEVIPLSDFIHEFGEGLLSAVQQQNPPIYDGVPNSRHAILMEALLRKPFPPQQDAVQAKRCFASLFRLSRMQSRL